MEKRRVLIGETPIRRTVADELTALGLDDEEAWLEEHEKRIEGLVAAAKNLVIIISYLKDHEWTRLLLRESKRQALRAGC